MPIEGTVHLLARVATVTSGGKLHFVVDGKAHAPVAVLKTSGGQQWATVDAGAFAFAHQSYHSVALVCDTPGISINWWQVRTLPRPNGAHAPASRACRDK